MRTTLQQAGVVRDALERGAREGRSRLDSVRSSRRRNDALAELGEIVLDLIRRGEIDLGELPEAKALVRQLDELDDDAAGDDDVATPPSRSRFDDRGPRASASGQDDRPGRTDRDDGTVSSGAHLAPSKRSATPQRVWRPAEADPPAAPKPAGLPRDPHRKGGIQFDNDDDLADYMHPDDVPPKPTDGDR